MRCPQEILRARETPRLLLRKNAELDELADIVDAIDVLGDPEQPVEVAQTALPLLDVGFDMVARIAKTMVARLALGELRLDEFPRTVLDDRGLEPTFQIVEDGLVAPNVT